MRAGVLAAVFVVVCMAQASAQQGGVRVQSSTYAYIVPAGYTESATEGVDRMHVSRAAPGRSINIVTESFSGSPAEYLQASLQGLAQQPQARVRSSRPVMVGSLPGFEVESDWQSEGTSVHLLQLGTSWGGNGFVLTCADVAQRFAQAEPECRAIFRSFVVGPDLARGGQRVEGAGYAYVVPSGWTESGGSTERMHASNTSPGRSANLSVEPFSGAPSAYREASLIGVRQEPRFRVIQVREAMVGSLPGFEIEGLWLEEGMTLHLLQLGTSFGGRGFILTCGDLEQNFQGALSECRGILSSFVVGNAAVSTGYGPHGTPASAPVAPVFGTPQPTSSSVEAVTARVRAAVDGRGAELYECQAAALRRGPVSGQVELELVVRRNGTAAGVRVIRDTTRSEGLASCVQGVVAGIVVRDPPVTDTTVRHNVAFGQ